MTSYFAQETLCAAEERLRRGWVSVRGEQLVAIEREMDEYSGCSKTPSKHSGTRA